MPVREKKGPRLNLPSLTPLQRVVYLYLVSVGAFSPATASPIKPIGDHARKSGLSDPTTPNGINATLTPMYDAGVLARCNSSATKAFEYYIPSSTDYLIALCDEDRNSND